MPTHVYANGLEIVCGASDGVASTAFPDPCASPPGPPAGPVIVPYGNVARAQDLTNGSCTVFIGGEPVALEDQSYFATSTGNEAATQAFGQGVISGAIQGKAYFRSWSLTVMIEGKGVARHTDLVTHNHGSFPANTPMFPYLSRRQRKIDCRDENQQINRACKPEISDSNLRKEIRAKSKIGPQLKQHSKQKNYERKKKQEQDQPWRWTDEHCDGLHKLPKSSLKAAEEYADELRNVFISMPDELAALQQLEELLKDMALNAAQRAAIKWGRKAAAKQILGGTLPGAGNTVMSVMSGLETLLALEDVNEIRQVAQETLKQLDVLHKEFDNLKKLAERFKNFTGLSDKEKFELVADGQSMLATLNACTRARKCMLVPHKNKGGRGSRIQPAYQRKGGAPSGCCPGQTGHHLILDAMAKDGACTREYNSGSAPTVCVEGNDQYHGTHGLVHDKMDFAIKKLSDQGAITAGTISFDDAISAAVKSHAEAFPLSGCSRKCIKVQLEAYYKNICNGGRFKAIFKKGKLPVALALKN